MNNNEVAIVIPAFNPTIELLDLVQKLDNYKYPIIIINDGSQEQFSGVFKKIESQFGEITIYHQVENKGKGAGLKKGFEICMLKYPNSPGVVTADADGQHGVKDIVKLADKLKSTKSTMILGVREFCKEVPFKSRFGNILTRKLFRFVHGINVSDTQTGLRAIPKNAFPHFLNIQYNRYEFETEMLIRAKKNNMVIDEVNIETIYMNNNSGSYFNPIFDSMKIYFVLFRFVFSSLLAAVVDIVMFAVFFKLTTSILLSILISRYSLGAGINFYLNWKKVFKTKGRFYPLLIKYYLLATVLGFSTFLLMKLLIVTYNFQVIYSKILIEGLLFVASFFIQKALVFSRDSSK